MAISNSDVRLRQKQKGYKGKMDYLLNVGCWKIESSNFHYFCHPSPEKIAILKNLLRSLLFSYIFLHSLSVFSKVSFQRVDLPFWWTGMADSSRQLMFYRNNIAQSNVIINYTGTILKSTTRIENPNYLILDLEITEDARPGNIPIVFEYQREFFFRLIIS